MLTTSIFIIFLIIPLIYCLHKNKLKYFYYCAVLFYWFPIKLPFAGMLGSITFSECFIYSGVVFYFIETRRFSKIKNLSLSPIIVIGLFFYFLGGLISAFNSIDNFYLYLGFRRLIILPIAIVFLSLKVFTDPRTIKTTIRFLSYSTIIFLVVMLIHPKTAYFISYRGRMSFRFGGEYALFGKYSMKVYESTLGAVIGYLSPLFFSISLWSINKKSRYVNITLFILLIIFLVLTLGRCGWIAATAGCIFVYLLYAGVTRKMSIMNIIITITFIIFMFMSYENLINLPLFDIVKVRFLTMFNASKISTFDMRAYQWIWGLEVFKNNIFGIGMNNFYKTTGFLYAGNSTWVSMLLDVGVIGAFGFLVVYFRSIYNALKGIALRNVEIRIIAIGLLGGILAFVISGTTENLLFNMYSSFPFWLFVGMSQSLKSLELPPQK